MAWSEFIVGGIRGRKNPHLQVSHKWATNMHFHYVSPLALLLRISLLTFFSIPAFFPCRTQSSSSTQSLQPPLPPPPAQPMVGAADDTHRHGGVSSAANIASCVGGAQDHEVGDENNRLLLCL